MKKISTKDLAKKQREAYFLNRVKCADHSFPSGEIVPGEEPDFLINTDSRIIGVEMVDYIRGQGANGSSLREYEILTDRIVNLSKAKFEQDHGIPLMVHFHWIAHCEPRSMSISELSTEIARLVSANTPQEIYAKCTIETDMCDDLTVSEFVATISVVRLKPHQNSLWANIGVGFSGVSIEELQALILTKEPRINAYMKKCDVVWLLIVADASHISSICHLKESVCGHKYQSGFERVIFYDACGNRIIILKQEQ